MILRFVMEHHEQPVHSDRLLTMAKAARLMGMEAAALRMRVKRGAFPFVAVTGGPPKIRFSDVEPFIPKEPANV